jgi:predicted membrane GTPase involved in stress response
MTDSAVTLIAAENRLVWHLGESTEQVDHARWDQQVVTLEARGEIGAGILIEVTARQPFELEVEAGTAVFYESVPAGRTQFVLTHLDRGDVRQL